MLPLSRLTVTQLKHTLDQHKFAARQGLSLLSDIAGQIHTLRAPYGDPAPTRDGSEFAGYQHFREALELASMPTSHPHPKIDDLRERVVAVEDRLAAGYRGLADAEAHLESLLRAVKLRAGTSWNSMRF